MLAYLLILFAVLGIYFASHNLYLWCRKTSREACNSNMKLLHMVTQLAIVLIGMAGAYRYAIKGRQ